MEQNSPDLLEEYHEQVYMEPVSAGTRLGNYILDAIVVYVLVLAFEWVYALLLTVRIEQNYYDNDVHLEALLFGLFINAVIRVIYYTLAEGSSQGRTLGKLVTRSVAVKEDGTPITFKEAFLRSLCRLIPFNAISGINGRPWHDSITRTLVIKKQ